MGTLAAMSGAFTITSWNVNSIRARLDHVLTYLADHEPDVVCLQETKVEDALFPRVPFLELGYVPHVYGSKGLAGVATFTRGPAGVVQRGFIDGEPEPHCRRLAVQWNGVWIYNLYCPNGTELGSEAFAYKLAWFARLRAELDVHRRPDEAILLVGDFNVVPEPRDVWDPAGLEGRLLFTAEERAALAHVAAFGFHDCFRRLEPGAGHYSWYDYRTNGFQRNEGMRIDHVYATSRLADRCTSVIHDPEPRGWDVPSDHLPVVARFDSEPA